jgi:CBS domain-containing protein
MSTTASPDDVTLKPAIERTPVRCSEVMKSPVQWVSEKTMVRTAARIMRDAEIGFLPICHDHGTVVGIVTDRDIVTRVCAEDQEPGETVVSTVMTRGVLTCRVDDSIAKAERLMREHRITRIVITDALRKPVGIISLSDLVHYENAGRVKRTLQAVAERKYAPERP